MTVVKSTRYELKSLRDELSESQIEEILEAFCKNNDADSRKKDNRRNLRQSNFSDYILIDYIPGEKYKCSSNYNRIFRYVRSRGKQHYLALDVCTCSWYFDLFRFWNFKVFLFACLTKLLDCLSMTLKAEWSIFKRVFFIPWRNWYL